MLRAVETRMGPTALLEREGLGVVVATIRQQPIHQEAFTHLGLDLAGYPVIGVKSSAHFRSGFQELAETILVVLAPGVNQEDPTSFPYTRVRPGLRLAGGTALGPLRTRTRQ
jgi:microcystin degradation protein MlrC